VNTNPQWVVTPVEEKIKHKKVDWLAGCETKQTLLLVLFTLFS
jgi:hypothetical protein